MLGLFGVLFVRRLFLSVRPPKNIKKSYIKFFGLVPYSTAITPSTNGKNEK